MRGKLMVALGAAWFALAGPALAQATPSPAEIHAQARGMIAEARASDVLEDITPDGSPMMSIRHNPSGLVCLFFPDTKQQEISVEASGGVARGETVSCSTHVGSVNYYAFATRYPKPPALEAHLARAAGDLIKILSGKTIDEPPPPARAYPFATVGVLGVRAGKPSYARARVAQIGDWTVSFVVINAGSADTKLADEMLAAQSDAALNWMVEWRAARR